MVAMTSKPDALSLIENYWKPH